MCHRARLIGRLPEHGAPAFHFIGKTVVHGLLYRAGVRCVEECPRGRECIVDDLFIDAAVVDVKKTGLEAGITNFLLQFSTRGRVILEQGSQVQVRDSCLIQHPGRCFLIEMLSAWHCQGNPFRHGFSTRPFSTYVLHFSYADTPQARTKQL